MRDQNIPPGAPDGVGEIHVLLVAGKTVQQQDDRMGTRAGRQVEDGVEAGAVADDVGRFHRGRKVVVPRRIGGDRSRKLLGSSSDRQHQGGNGDVENGRESSFPHRGILSSILREVKGMTHAFVRPARVWWWLFPSAAIAASEGFGLL
jgi:hypothetical protein